MPPTLDPAWEPPHCEQTWAPAGRARAGTHNAVLSHHCPSDVATEESDAGPMRSRSQRRSTVGADFHRSSASHPLHERYGFYPSAHLPQHMHQHPSPYSHQPHPPFQHPHSHAHPHSHPYYIPDPDSRRSSGQTSMLHQGTPVSTPPPAPSSQGSRSTTPGWASHLTLSRSNEEGAEAAPPSGSSAPSQPPATTTKPDPPATSSSKPSSSKPASATGGTSGKSADKPTDRRRRRKIPFSYSSLIAQAISSSPEGKMTLREIYAWINWAYPDLYSFDGPDTPGWQNTVRHNLSLNKMFVKVPRSAVGTRLSDRPAGWGSVTFPRGKGGYWMLDSSIVGTPIALPGPQRGASTSAMPPQGAPGAPLPHLAPTPASAPPSVGQTMPPPLSRAELDARFQHSMNLNDCSRPYPPAPPGMLPSEGGPPGGFSHSAAPIARTKGRRRAVTYNATAQGESDYVHAYVYGAPYSAGPPQSGPKERSRARGYTTTAAEVNRDLPRLAYTDLGPGAAIRPTYGERAPEGEEMQLDSPTLERQGERQAKCLPARMSISGMLNN